MLRLYSLALFLTGFASAVQAQMPTYQVGRIPTQEEIIAADNVVGPMGMELLPGAGSAREGAAIYAQKCGFCHGAEGQGGGGFPRLVGGTIHPFATSYWSIIYSSMPRAMPAGGVRNGTLTTDEAYALTAWILYKNGIIEEDTVMNAESLPRVPMPTRDPRIEIWAPSSGN